MIIKKAIKWLSIGLISCLLILTTVMALLQTDWSKEILQKKLEQLAKKEGVTLSLGSIKGDLPFNWTLEDIFISFNETESLKIDALRLRVSPLSFFGKQIIINYLSMGEAELFLKKKEPKLTLPSFLSWTISLKSFKIDSLLFNTTSYSVKGKAYCKKNGKACLLDVNIISPDFNAKLHLKGRKDFESFLGKLKAEVSSSKFESGTCNLSFSILPNEILEIEQISLKSDLLCLKGKGRLDSSFHPIDITTSFLLPHLSYASPYLAGILTGDLCYTKEALTCIFQSEELKAGSVDYKQTKGEIKALLTNGTWDGTLCFEAPHATVPIELKTLLSYSDSLCVKDFSLKMAESQIAGDGVLSFPSHTITGSFFIKSDDLAPFASFFPDSNLKGSLAGMFSFNSDSASFYGLSQNLQCYDLLSRQIILKGVAFDLLTEPMCTLSLEGETTYFKQFLFDDFLFLTHLKKERSTFNFSSQGEWKEPFNCSSSGSFYLSDTIFDLELDTLKGNVLKKSFEIQKPFSIQLTDKALVLSEFDLKLKEGYFLASMDLNQTLSKIRVKAEHFPIDLLALSTSRFTLTGNCSLDVVLDGSKDSLQGRANVLLEKADILQSGKKEPIHSKGAIQINLDQNMAQIHANFKASGQQFFEITGSAPVVYNFYPLKFGIDRKKPLWAELTMEGHLEEIFDFINIGSHSTTGLLSCHLLASHNLNKPLLQGTLEIQNGSYENYLTGMFLKEINVEGRAERSILKITSIKASDQEEGSLVGTGSLDFSPLSFSFDFNLDNLKVIHLNWLTGLFSGPVNISGSPDSALAKGELVITQAQIEIPDTLPVDLPILPFDYIHKPPHISKMNLSPKENYPFCYDLILHAPKNIFLTGRGLNAELQGNLSLKGKNITIEGDGNLNVIKGTFSFSGKEFILTQGTLSFARTPNPNAYLNLSATLSLPDMTVTALLRGPLNAPILTLQSSPTMPTSSILARILFNKDISELSALQAAQLAYSIVSLSGNSGPNVFEIIRKSLGVDRLNISSPSGDSEHFTVQIGKYLTKGVMITLSQSTETSQVIVEVELKNGFVLQAETQENDQAKFSLKWNKNY